MVAHPSARRCQPRARSVLAVPPGFDGFLRATPAGLLHPAPDHGVRSVSGQRRRTRLAALPTTSSFPGTAFHTLQSLFPRPQPYRVTAALAPASFHDSRAPKCEAPSRPRGLAPPTSPVSGPDVAAATDPLLSWASFPSRVLPEFSASPSPGGLVTRPSLSFGEAGSRRPAALRRPFEESGGVLPVPRRSVRSRSFGVNRGTCAESSVLAGFASGDRPKPIIVGSPTAGPLDQA
jgi:hypothetical protein